MFFSHSILCFFNYFNLFAVPKFPDLIQSYLSLSGLASCVLGIWSQTIPMLCPRLHLPVSQLSSYGWVFEALFIWFLYKMKDRSEISVFCVKISSFSQNHLLNGLPSYCVFSMPLSKLSWQQMHSYFSELHQCPISLCVCSYASVVWSCVVHSQVRQCVLSF